MTTRLSKRLSPQTILDFPGYQKHLQLGVAKAYTFEAISPQDWYNSFISRVKFASEQHQFFPIYRMGDGEYSFAVGNFTDILPWTQLSLKEKLKKLKRWVFNESGRHKSGYPDVGYESYSGADLKRARSIFTDALSVIGAHGYLALGLDDSNLYKKYFPYIIDWFDHHNIPFNAENYIHVYCVYAMLCDSNYNWLFHDKTVLIISGFIENEDKIISYLTSRGVKAVEFLYISKTHSMFDKIDLRKLKNTPEMVFVSAGVGSANILSQLRGTSTVCIDIGFILRIWANDDLKWDRPFCVSDKDFDINKIRYL